MGLRSRVKKRLKSLMGGEGSTGNTAPGAPAGRAPASSPRSGAPSPVKPAPASALTVSASNAAVSGSPASTPPASAGPNAGAQEPKRVLGVVQPSAGLPPGAVSRGQGGAVTPLAGDSEEEARRLEKQRRFMARARRGVLAHIDQQGGAMSMKDMHDHSERRYFIAHRAFSDMMEFFIDQRYIDYNPSTMQVRLTEDGRAFSQEEAG